MASALPSRRDGRADGVARPADALPGLRHLGSPLAIDLWIADLDAAVDDASIALDETESARAARFVFDRDRRRYLAAHRLLRGLLASRTGISAGALSIAADPNGKPHLVDHPCAFNLSHSGDVVLIGTADDGEVGVDVEVLRPTLDLDVVVRSHFSAGERWTIESLAPGARDLAFLVGWTRKEACLKAVGVGLNIDPASIDAGICLSERTLRIESAEVVVQALVCDGRAVCAVARASRS
jgi:4'-phosphopantetheinyl transferase